jgi:transcriptional regulator with XRE-family HTH domain
VGTLSKRRRLDDLKDRETRQIFYSEHNLNAIPIQIRELRKKRGLTQKELASLAETDQGYISNLENPNFEYAPQIGTLERLANAFDVPLIVRFGSWEELWDWENHLTPERLAPKTFEDSLPSLEATLEAGDIATDSQTKGNLRVILGKQESAVLMGESSQRKLNFHIRGLATNPTLSYSQRNIRPRLFEGESTPAIRRAK